jgi:hypothetical protein
MISVRIAKKKMRSMTYVNRALVYHVLFQLLDESYSSVAILDPNAYHNTVFNMAYRNAALLRSCFTDLELNCMSAPKLHIHASQPQLPRIKLFSRGFLFLYLAKLHNLN